MKRVLSEYGLHWHLLKYNIPQNFPQGNGSLSLQTSNKAKHFLFIVVLYNCFRHFKLIYLLRESNASFYIVDAIVAQYLIESVAWLVRFQTRETIVFKYFNFSLLHVEYVFARIVLKIERKWQICQIADFVLLFTKLFI